MEDIFQNNYNSIISELEKDFNAEIKLIDELYLKHKDNFRGGYIIQAIKEELNFEREDFLAKWNWAVPSAIFDSVNHRKLYLEKCTEYCSKVYNYPFKVVDF
ncbi:hypothetical protein NQT66_13225 [Cellulophaga baltica]|uniref:hypothetical protein n=1 Tax=Cellulophaga baltica TaxID=76594 RepID=UPI0021485C87|nr:hypothetical protein [Cellulophaga baltica]MCR1025778.1 hypothetical protein [Cellulophaga baltica]